jgi:hypothetical protein
MSSMWELSSIAVLVGRGNIQDSHVKKDLWLLHRGQ